MNERVKQLRKTLGLTQQEFAQQIGLNKVTISSIETGHRDLTDRNISIICSTFHVNESWLRNGENEMFLDPDDSLLQTLKDRYNLSDNEFEIIYHYIKMPPPARQMFITFINNLSSNNE